jgi:ABC-type uncharacterized transport system, periplasmic component
MRRREFITLLGGALADQAIPANAQEPVRVRTVGALMGFANDAEAKARTEAFEKGLESEGWSLGQNLRIEYRYAEGDSARMQALAKELVELKPGLHSRPEHPGHRRVDAGHADHSYRVRRRVRSDW